MSRQLRREVDCTAAIIVGTSTAVSLAVPRCSAEPVVFAARRKSFEMTTRNFLPRTRLRDDTTGAAAGIITVNNSGWSGRAREWNRTARDLGESPQNAPGIDVQAGNRGLKLPMFVGTTCHIDHERIAVNRIVMPVAVAVLGAFSISAFAVDSSVPTTLGIETKAKKEERAKHHAKKKESVKHAAKHGKPKSGLGEASKAETGAPAAPTAK